MSYNANSGEVFTGGATTSQHIDAEDDDHFENTTFKLKRTRSLGLLDEFIDPEKQEERIDAKNDAAASATSTVSASAVAAVHSLPSPHTPKDEPLQSDSPQITSPTLAFLASPDLLPHDDSDLVAEPSRHVDYLSHQWDVSDISKSWRYVILRRKDVANAARLENASWRTWAQRRSNLKTISPEEVNWSKESDVTWLYGPIVDDDDNDMDHDHESRTDDCKSGTASSMVAGDISIARKKHGPKPILKKRTVQDMMISHLNLLKLQVATARSELEQARREDAEAQARKDKSTGSERPPEYFDYNLISAKLNSQYKNYSTQNSQAGSRNNSEVNLASINPVAAADLSAKLQEVSNQRTESKPTESVPESAVAKEPRHIHFNDEVQQCIAVDEFSDENAEYDYDDDYDNDYDYGDDESYIYETYEDGASGNLDAESYDDEDDEDDEGGFFLKVRSPSSASVAGLVMPGLTSTTTKDADQTEDSEPESTDSKVYKTIHLLPPTTLNYGSSDEDSDECNPYTSSLSHNVDNSTSRGYDYYYDYNTVYQVDPNHAIFGSKKVPVVVDVPENITLGSNFDYEIIENDDVLHFENAPLGPGTENVSAVTPSGDEEKDRLPISSLDNSATIPLVRPNPFSLDALDSSDSDSDEEGGLSINAKSSSQSLAQLVFGHSLTAAHSRTPDAEENYPTLESAPNEGHIISINPRYSSTSLSKQPHSSSSLADQFLNTGMTKSSGANSLSDAFFNVKSPEPRTPSSLSLAGAQSPPVQKKTSPLPPHTTSANAFLGTSTPPPPGQTLRKGFMLDSDSESEDEFVEDVMLPAYVDKNAKGYASLYQVADRNGISVPTQSEEDAGQGQKHRVGLAMVNFLGGWNKGS